MHNIANFVLYMIGYFLLLSTCYRVITIDSVKYFLFSFLMRCESPSISRLRSPPHHWHSRLPPLPRTRRDPCSVRDADLPVGRPRVRLELIKQTALRSTISC